MDATEAKRLKALEDENQRLKQIVANLTLDNTVLKDLLGKPRNAGVRCATPSTPTD